MVSKWFREPFFNMVLVALLTTHRTMKISMAQTHMSPLYGIVKFGPFFGLVLGSHPKGVDFRSGFEVVSK